MPRLHDAPSQSRKTVEPFGQQDQPDVLNEDGFTPPPPLDMPPGQIDGLDSLQAERFRELDGLSPRSDDSGMMHLRLPGLTTTTELAMAAMQYLPTPLIVLSSLKTVVLANEAMGRLLGFDHANEDGSDDGKSTLERLRGQTLSQVGIDMIQDGR